MPRYIAFLRAINVGGHTVKMDELRRLFTAFGCSNVETFIASGNVIFETRASDEGRLARTIAAGLHETLGYEVATFVRTDAEVASVVAHRPFPQRQLDAAKALCVGFLAAPLDAASVRRLMALKTDIDDFHVHGREIFWLCLEKQSDSKFSNASFEKAVGVKATFRGINTVRKLAARYPPRRPPGGTA